MPLISNEWRDAMQDAAAAITEAMGERVTVTPVQRPGPNMPTAPDPDKAFTVEAVFSSKPVTVFKERGRDPRSENSVEMHAGINTRAPIFSFETCALPGPIRRGFRITRCDGEAFEVTKTEPDGISRVECSVVQLGRAAQ